MLIYIIRHGETDSNVEGRFQGRSDIPLNQNGIDLAYETGRGMQGIKFDAVFTSPLSRARKTAEILLEETGCKDIPIFVDDRLLEVDMGDFEGRRSEPKYGDITKEEYDYGFKYLKDDTRLPNGESILELKTRTQTALKEIAKKPFDSILVSTHGCAMRAMLAMFYKPGSDFWHGQVPYNCCVNIIESQNGKMELIEEDKLYYDPQKAIDRFKI